MMSRIEKLIRTNIALFLLCVISIGVLVILFGRSHIQRPVVSESSQQDRSASVEVKEDPLLHSPLRNMPATSTFTHVVYNGQSTIPVSLTCADAYSVVLMFSDAVDYRIDPVSALYNRAIPCQSVATTTERIDLSLIRMTKGDGYYIIRAHEGASGMWHDPY